jgi:hypothetical protein
MNVNAINRTIDAVRNDTTHRFDMRDYASCIAAFAQRSSEEYDSADEYGHSEMATLFGIDRNVAYRLAHPVYNGTYADVTREQAASVLEHFRDTGLVNWKILNKKSGLIRKLYGKVRGLFS